MSNRVPFKAVQAFEAAARLSSFALAAEELFVTPSAISHQIKQLEERLSVLLFHRIHRAVVLTDAGRRYAEEILAAFARIETATRDLSRQTKSDILKIHSSPSIAAQWLMPRLARFSAQNPDIDVHLKASTEPVNLFALTADIDIHYSSRNIQPSGILSLMLPPENIVPLCSPELAKGIHAPDDMSTQTLIHSEGCLVGWRDWARINKVPKLNLSRGLRFDRSFMSVGAAVDGLGVCLDSTLMAQREIESGALVAPFGLDGLKVQGYSFNILKSSADLPKISAFRAWLFAELQEEE